MKLVSRAQWGARAYKTPGGATRYSVARLGVKVHYLGTPYSDRPHEQCAAYVRGLQASHMDGNGWSDIGYSFVVCTHGYVHEGRGLARRNSANGTTALNERHYAVCALVGSSGLTRPTDAQLHGIRDAIEYCRASGPAGNEIRGHRDGYSTDCPGGPLYAWVQAGAPRPGGTSPGPSIPTPSIPTPVQRKKKMALVSKTVPQVIGDDSATVLTAVPGGRVFVNVSADYVPPGEQVAVRIDVSDGTDKERFVLSNVNMLLRNGQVGVLELPEPDRTRVVSIKRLSHERAVLDACLHFPEA